MTTGYDDVITTLRSAGLDARHEMLGIGYSAIIVRRSSGEIRVTDLDGPLPDGRSDLTGWWAALYPIPGFDPTEQRDFAPDDIEGMAAWLAALKV